MQLSQTLNLFWEEYQELIAKNYLSRLEIRMMCQVRVKKCLWHRQAAFEYHYAAICLLGPVIESGNLRLEWPTAQSTKLLKGIERHSSLTVDVLWVQLVERSTKLSA